MTRRGARMRLAAALITLGACAGCGSHPPRIVSNDPATRSQALIDDGNAAYRRHDYKRAAERYAIATVVKKDDPAAYFGLGMALKALGRDEEARAAYARARELAQRAREEGR